MIALPQFDNFDSERQYLLQNKIRLIDDAVNEFYATSCYSKELEERFIKLRPCDHETAEFYIGELRKRLGDDSAEGVPPVAREKIP